jgi:CubicO group peptidase (beta-lactamase class C family)
MLTSCAGSGSTSDGLAAAVDGIFRDYDRPDAPGASVGIFRDGRIVLAKGYGAADLESGLRADERTNYRLASVTKQFTAMAVAKLKEEAKLAYDDPLARHLEGLPAWGSAVTIRQLVGHTSGVADYEDHLPPPPPRQVLDRDVLEIVRQRRETLFPPGTRYKYSNSGYALLALVVERASGKDFAAFLRERIFDPLGMSATVAHESGKSSVANRAYGYEEKAGKWVRDDQSRTSAVLGDGGIYCSVADYFKWDQSLHAAPPEIFTTGRLSDGSPTGYGFGWRLDGERAHHDGSTVGFSNAVTRLASRRTTVIVLTNRGVEGSARKLCDRVVALVAGVF